jgi:hypothetical protein
MKTIITLLTTVMLAAGATSAMASDQQGSNQAPGYQLSLQQAARSFGGAYASARIPGHVRNSTFNVPTSRDVQLDGR